MSADVIGRTRASSGVGDARRTGAGFWRPRIFNNLFHVARQQDINTPRTTSFPL